MSERQDADDVLPPHVEEVRVLRLQAGDVIVAKMDDYLSPEQVKAVSDKLEAMFPNHKVAICMGLTLEVARPEQSDGSVSAQ